MEYWEIEFAHHDQVCYIVNVGGLDHSQSRKKFVVMGELETIDLTRARHCEIKSPEFAKLPGVVPTLISFCLYFHSPLDYVRVGSTPIAFYPRA